VKAGLAESKAALLVRIGALTDGQKIVLAVESGPRESPASWGAVRRDLRTRGLKPWRGTIADGQLGIWAALAEQHPMAAEPRCGNHRITQVWDVIPPTQQAQARTRLCAMPYAASQAAGEQLRTPFDKRSRQLAPNAVERLAYDWDRLVTFSQSPREHWRHLRTTNVVESPFATARRRTGAAQRFQKVDSATAIIWKRLQVAERPFRRVNAPELLPAVYAGAQYLDGITQSSSHHPEVAAGSHLHTY
jgi:putative transposase